MNLITELAPLHVGRDFAYQPRACTWFHLAGLYKVDRVLGWGHGQLGPDLLIFTLCYLLRTMLESKAHSHIIAMEREVRAAALAEAQLAAKR